MQRMILEQNWETFIPYADILKSVLKSDSTVLRLWANWQVAIRLSELENLRHIEKQTLEAMKAHQPHPDVQVIGCIVVGDLSKRFDNYKTPVTEESAEIILSAMTTHADNVTVQIHACNALESITANAERKEKEFILQSASCALSKRRDDATMGKRSSRIAAQGEFKDRKTKIFKMIRIPERTPEVIVSAMRRHCGHQEFLCGAIRALKNFSFNEASEKIIMSHGAHKVILAAMVNHTGHCEIQKEGFGALAKMGLRDKTELEHQGAFDIIFKAIMNFKDEASIQTLGCDALEKLSEDAFKKKQMLEAVLTAMKHFGYEPRVQVMACTIISSHIAEFGEFFAVRQVHEYIFCALSRFMKLESWDVVKSSLETLEVLVKSKSGGNTIEWLYQNDRVAHVHRAEILSKAPQSLQKLLPRKRKPSILRF